MVKAKLLNFTEKLKTDEGNEGHIWSRGHFCHLPFAVT